MPQVHTRTKNRGGKERYCGRCSKAITPGEIYYQWSFRYGGTHYRCKDHYPRSSELTQSKMSQVYAAIEDAEDALPGVETPNDVRELVATAAEQVREVVEEYQEAAEQFGGVGENQERADELEGWADELDNFDPDSDSLTLDEIRDEAREVLGGCPL